MDSNVGLIVQLNGVILITVLSLCLRRSLRLTALKYWAMAWLCLSFALICLRLAFSYEEYASFLFTYYFLGEYLFGYMLVAGCRSLDGKYELKPRSELMIVPFVIAAIALPYLVSSFNDAFNLHALILAGFFATAFYWLRRSKQSTFGWRVMHISLALLTVDFSLYSILFSAGSIAAFPTAFISYHSAVDLVLQAALGVGMVIILLEKVLDDYESTNDELRSAQKQLENLVHTDPLTSAFNRHAFYGFVRKQGEDQNAASGCVGFFDIDDLKVINDCFGHAAGDVVIRSVVRAIREIIRAEDLIYRWGGDEFFVVMVSMDAARAEDRMARLDTLLQAIKIDKISKPISVGVSWGFTNYATPDDLDNAMKAADAEMYTRKLERKESRMMSTDFINSLPGGVRLSV